MFGKNKEEHVIYNLMKTKQKLKNELNRRVSGSVSLVKNFANIS